MNSNRKRTLGVFTTLFSLAVGAVLYPMALALVLVADTVLGDAEFVRYFLYESKREAVLIILGDWLQVLPYTLAGWLVLRGMARLGWSRIISPVLGLAALVFIVLAFIPPYLPLIFGALLFCAILASLFFDWLLRRTRS